MGSKTKYAFQSLQKENFWLPPVFAALFLIIVALMSPAQKENVGRAFLSFFMPLLSGGLAAYAFLADPGLELQFATKRSAARMIFERLGVIFGIMVIIGSLYQVGLSALGVSLSVWGGFWQQQLVWHIPSLTTISLGAMAGLLARNPNGGFALVGGLWITQILARSWFASHRLARYIFLFYAAMYPSDEPRGLNQVVLVTLSLIFVVFTHVLLKKQERYL